MDLLDRYLQAVRRALPASKADDIVAELGDVLATRAEEREDTLGRPLTRDETAALIKEFGHPLVVAARYRPQQWLIGPDVFPFYVSVMRIVAMFVVVAAVALAAARAIFGHEPVWRPLAQTGGTIWVSLIVAAAAVTIVFAILERAGFPADHLRRWNPNELPDVADKAKNTWEAAFEIAVGILFLIWWMGFVHIPAGSREAGFRIEPAPVFGQLYWPILALAIIRLIQNVIEWLRPRWKAVHAVLAGLTTVAGLALLSLIYRAAHWAVVVSSSMPAGKAAELEAGLNLALKIAIVVTGFMWLLQAAGFLWRLIRSRAA